MTYLEILSSDFFWDTYSQIEYMKNDFPVNHGFVHVYSVIKWCKKLSEIFQLSEKEKELLLISATLHDIGYTHGRDDHATYGAIDAREYLDGKLAKEDIDRVCSAIANHSGKKIEDYIDNVSMCLILSDKFNFEKTRYRLDPNYPSTKKMSTIENIELIKNDEDYDLVITTTTHDLKDTMSENYYLNKLQKKLDILYDAKNIKINIKIIEV